MNTKQMFGRSLRWAGRYRFTIMFVLITWAAAAIDELFHYVAVMAPAFLR